MLHTKLRTKTLNFNSFLNILKKLTIQISAHYQHLNDLQRLTNAPRRSGPH